MPNTTKESPELADVQNIWNKFVMTGASQIFVAIFDAIQEGIEIVDTEGIVKYVNPAFETILGIKASERVGKDIRQLVPNGTLARVLQSGYPLPGEKLYINDAKTDIIVNTSPILVDKKMVGAVAIFQAFSDVTKLLAELNTSKKLVKDLNQRLSSAMSAKYSFADIIGQCEAIRQSISVSKRAARTEATVLLTGETGTGKELFAHAIHLESQRFNRPFVKLNCAAVPENLLESEFFGYEKGAFSGAAQRKLGMFDLAMHGTIFLDEIGELELQLQAKLLRVLEEGEMYRVGGTKPVSVDVRVIAATNRNLLNHVREGKFREDLYYRLNVLNVEIPPLRARQGDIPELVEYFIDRFNRKHGRVIRGFNQNALKLLVSYDWPGNVRELKNAVQQAVIMAEANYITAKELRLILRCEKEAGDDKLASLQEMEHSMIALALERFGTTLEGKVKAAEVLGISLRTLYNKMKRYGIIN